jgi:hypothetical protein
MSTPSTISEAGTAPLRCIRICPWSRTIVTAGLPTLVRSCGCVDGDGRVLSDWIGRWQKAHVILGGDVLIVGVGVIGPTWWWGSLECRGLAIVLGGDWRHHFDDARASASDVRECVVWRRATARAA